MASSFPPREFQLKADRKSTDLRKALGLQAHARLDAFVLAKKLDVPVVCPSSIQMPKRHLDKILQHENGWSAVTVRIGERMLIIHNTCHDPDRQQSNLFHELGHILCKHPPQLIPLSSGMHRTEVNKTHENEADWLAAFLHLPRAALTHAQNTGMTFEATCAAYCASSPKLQFRLNMERKQLPRSRKTA